MIALEHKGLATPRSTFFFYGACARFVCAPPLSSFLAPPPFHFALCLWCALTNAKANSVMRVEVFASFVLE